MIKIEKLKKVYSNGYEALKSINLEINEGELVCLLGPSGCGKTTILNLLAGLLDPSDGDIKFDNPDTKIETSTFNKAVPHYHRNKDHRGICI